MPTLKQQLHALCLCYVDERIKQINQAIHLVQASANEETKSSAGDKYETGRAMAQLEIEKNSIQLTTAQKLREFLVLLSPTPSGEVILPGSVVITNQGRFYLSIPAEPFTIDDQIYFTVSPSAPIAQKLLGLRVGDEFNFNGKQFVIERVF